MKLLPYVYSYRIARNGGSLQGRSRRANLLIYFVDIKAATKSKLIYLNPVFVI